MAKEIIILGGGLWGGLLAYYLQHYHPHVNFKLHEKNDRLGGDHTWSFHQTDLDQKDFNFLRPLISYSWDKQTVLFPKRKRTLSIAYHTILSEDFHQKLTQLIPENKLVFKSNVEIENFPKDSLIIDCRNQFSVAEKGHQHFVGLDVSLEEPHNISYPIIMDATVDQTDGYRFIYYLPFTSNRILIEDTRYTLSSHLDVENYRQEVLNEMKKKNFKVEKVNRIEVGSLPIPLTPPLTKNKKYPNTYNLSGNFHDVTGYSLPLAVKAARELTSKLGNGDLSHTNKSTLILFGDWSKTRRFFYRMLNHLLFFSAPPDQRYRILEHFYRLPEKTIGRFYRVETHLFDFFLILSGRPPVKVLSALKVMLSYFLKPLVKPFHLKGYRRGNF